MIDHPKLLNSIFFSLYLTFFNFSCLPQQISAINNSFSFHLTQFSVSFWIMKVYSIKYLYCYACKNLWNENSGIVFSMPLWIIRKPKFESLKILYKIKLISILIKVYFFFSEQPLHTKKFIAKFLLPIFLFFTSCGFYPFYPINILGMLQYLH